LSFSSLDTSQLASAGKDGMLCMYDTSARILKSKHQAHEVCRATPQPPPPCLIVTVANHARCALSE
jgi:hypothetical protein